MGLVLLVEGKNGGHYCGVEEERVAHYLAREKRCVGSNPRDLRKMTYVHGFEHIEGSQV